MNLRATLLASLLMLQTGTAFTFPGESLLDSGKNACSSAYEYVKNPTVQRRLAYTVSWLAGAVAIWYGLKVLDKQKAMASEDIQNCDDFKKQLHTAVGWPEVLGELDTRNMYYRLCASSPEVAQKLKLLGNEVSMWILGGALLEVFPFLIIFNDDSSTHDAA